MAIKQNFIILQKGPKFKSSEPPEFHGVKSFREGREGLVPQKRTIHGKTKVFQAIRWLRTGQFAPVKAVKELKEQGRGKQTIAEGLRREWIKEGKEPKWVEQRIRQELWRQKTGKGVRAQETKEPKKPKEPKEPKEPKDGGLFLNNIQKLIGGLESPVIKEYAQNYYEWIKGGRQIGQMPDAPGALQLGNGGHLLRAKIRNLVDNKKDLEKWIDPARPPIKAKISIDNLEQEVERINGLNIEKVINLKDETAPGINDSYIIYFEDGTKAIFKPRKGDVHQSGVGPDHEVGTFIVSEILGFHIVPPTGFRTVQGKGEGSWQKWVRGKVAGKIRNCWELAQKEDPEGYIKMRLLDAIISNADRHNFNWVYDTGRKQVWAIDHGGCFVGGHRGDMYFEDIDDEEQHIPWFKDLIKKYEWGSQTTHDHIRRKLRGISISEREINGLIEKLNLLVRRTNNAVAKNKPITPKLLKGE